MKAAKGNKQTEQIVEGPEKIVSFRRNSPLPKCKTKKHNITTTRHIIGHAYQITLPLIAVKLPFAQGIHADKPLRLVKKPGKHCWQTAPAVADDSPEGQICHTAVMNEGG